LLSGLEEAIVNRFVLPSMQAGVERIKEWGRNCCLIDDVVTSDGVVIVERHGRAYRIASSKFTKEMREMVMTHLMDDTKVVLAGQLAEQSLLARRKYAVQAKAEA
jgi:hypothetical protein